MHLLLDESTKIKTPFYGKIAVLRTKRNAPLRLWMSPNFPQFRYDGEIQRAEEEMVMISDCNRNPKNGQRDEINERGLFILRGQKRRMKSFA